MKCDKNMNLAMSYIAAQHKVPRQESSISGTLAKLRPYMEQQGHTQLAFVQQCATMCNNVQHVTGIVVRPFVCVAGLFEALLTLHSGALQ